jgi:hypothetical protein
MFPSCPSWQRIPDPERCRCLLDRRTAHRAVVLAVWLCALHHVVIPAHVLAVKQPGHVGPGVVQRAVRRTVDIRHGALDPVGVRPLGSAVTRERVVRARAPGRPLRHLVERGRQAPRGVWLEHVILKHIALGVGPVVGNLPRVVVTHYVHALALARLSGADLLLRARAAVGVGGRAAKALLGLANKPVHPAGVDVSRRIAHSMWAAVV